MSSNPYKDYYDACNSDDEWSGLRQAEAKKRIQDLEYSASWTGDPISINDEYQFSGGS